MRYSVRTEIVNDVEYWMIYKRWWIFEWFFERWDTSESVSIRLRELCKNK